MGAGSGRRAALRNKKGSLLSFFFPHLFFSSHACSSAFFIFSSIFGPNSLQIVWACFLKVFFLGICFFSFRFYKTFFFPCVYGKKKLVSSQVVEALCRGGGVGGAGKVSFVPNKLFYY